MCWIRYIKCIITDGSKEWESKNKNKKISWALKFDKMETEMIDTAKQSRTRKG